MNMATKYTASAKEMDAAPKPDIEQMVEEHGDFLLRFCTLYLKDKMLAEDALQDTFIRAWKKQDTYRGEASCRTWLTKIALNVCRNYLRSPWSRRIEVTDFWELTEGRDGGYGQVDSRLDVMNAILQLKEKYRVVILLHYYEELSVKEIASIMGKKEATVLTQLKRGRECLHKLLQEQA